MVSRFGYITLLGLTLLCVGRVLAQFDLERDDIVYLVTAQYGGIEEIWSYDPIYGYSELVANLKQENNSIRDIEFDWDNGQIYLLRVEGGFAGFSYLGESQIVRVDMETLKEETVFSRKNILRLDLSPNGRIALLTVAPEDVIETNRDNLDSLQKCFVDVFGPVAECLEVDFGEQGLPLEVLWLGSDQVVYETHSVSGINVLNVATKDILHWAAPDNSLVSKIIPVPSTQNLLIYLTSTEVERTCYLYQLGLDEGSISTEQIMQLQCTSTIQFVDVSEDGSRLIIGYAGLPAILIDLYNREYVGEIQLAYGLEWNSIQWLDSFRNYLAIGELDFRGNPVLITTLYPRGTISLHTQPVPEGVVRIVVP